MVASYWFRVSGCGVRVAGWGVGGWGFGVRGVQVWRLLLVGCDLFGFCFL
jgi:hypothetical protein